MLHPQPRERRTLHEAVKANDVTAVGRLLDGGAKVNAVGRLMWTALHQAAFFGTTETAAVLVERGADLDARQKDDWTPLHLCSQQKSTAIAKMLVERGADLNAKERKGWTPLHICSQQGSTDIAKMLVAGKADLDAMTSKGFTPLHVSSQVGSTEIAKELLEGGATMDSADVHGRSALHHAVDGGHIEIVHAMLARETEDLVNLVDKNGLTALHIAAIAGSEQMAQALVDSGARVDIKDDEGNTPLNYANQDQERMKIILAVRITDEMSDSSTDNTNASSALSESVAWTPDAPYGSKNSVLKEIGAMKPGQVFADDYTIIGGNFAGKPNLLRAKHTLENKEVVLKFYWEEETLENTIEVHSKVAHSEHVCTIRQTLKTQRTGNPACIVFEKGGQTLRDWLKSEHSIMDRKWCLHQVLIGLKDMHAAYIVHGDVKPANVMLFPQSLQWKLIDLDGARKAGESRAVCFTTPHAAPEVLREWHEEGQLPVVQPSSDMWSFGILAYEVLTGNRMFADNLGKKKIRESVMDGKVDERIDSMVDDVDRDVVINLLKSDPKDRWTADDTLRDDAFAPDPLNATSEIQKHVTSVLN